MTPDEQVRADQIRARTNAATEAVELFRAHRDFDVFLRDESRAKCHCGWYGANRNLYDRKDAKSPYDAVQLDRIDHRADIAAKWLLDRLAAETAEVERLRDLVDEFRKRDETQDRIRESLNDQVASLTRLAGERYREAQEARHVSDRAEARLAAETERADKAEAAVPVIGPRLGVSPESRHDIVRFYFSDADPVAECGCRWRAVGDSATDAFRAWWRHSMDEGTDHG